MNIFLEDKITLPENKQTKQILYSHKKDKIILAVVYTQKIYFYDDLSKQLDFSYNTEEVITSVTWHPKQNSLCVGLQSGQIEVCLPEEQEAMQFEHIHKSQIIGLFYSRCGELMISHDQDLTMVFWIGQNPIKVEQRYAPITKMLFVDFQYEKLEGQKKTVKLVFLGDKMGNIEYFEEKKLVIKELSRMNGSIRELFFYEKTNTIVAITSTYYLYQFMISTKEDIFLDKKVKISMASQNEKLTGLCLQPNSFVLNSKESSLKFWNIEKDVNYGISLIDFIQAQQDKKLYVVHLEFDQIDTLLYICMSNNEILVLQGKANEIGEDKGDWKKIAVIQSSSTSKNLQQITVERSNNLALRYENEVFIYRRSKVKIFIEPSKKLQFLQKGLYEIEYGERNSQQKNFFSFQTKIKDFLVHDNHIAILDTDKKIYHFTLQEVMGFHSKLKPIFNKFESTNESSNFSKGGISVDEGIKKVILTKHGFCGIINQKKLIFSNYSNEILMHYRVSKKEEFFIDIIINIFNDAFALINNEFQMKIFVSTPKNIKIIYENLDLMNEIKSIKKCTKNEDKNRIIDQYQQNLHQVSKNSFPIKKIKIEKILINGKADVVIMITNQFCNNVILKNLKTDKTFLYSQEKSFLVQDAIFDSIDDRFIFLQVIDEFQKSSIMCLTTDDHQINFFEEIPIKSDQYLINGVFPTMFLSTHDEHNKIQILNMYPIIFRDLLKNRTQNAQLIQFCKNFGFDLSFENLQKCIQNLKIIEVDYDLDQFWSDLLKTALKNKNLPVTEFCLEMMKNVQSKNIIQSIQGSSKELSDNEKLAKIALAFNNVEIAKEIYFQEGQHTSIAEILFMEQSYQKLIEFCNKNLKTHLNYYYFKISLIYKEKKDYLKFIKFFKKSQVDEKMMIQDLIELNQLQWAKKYLQNKDIPQGNLQMFQYCLKNHQEDEAISYLEKNKENQLIVSDYFLNKKKDILQAQSIFKNYFSQNDGAAQERGAFYKKQIIQSAVSSKNFIDAVDYMLKEKSFDQLISYLQTQKEELQKNEDILSKVIDIIYNFLINNKSNKILYFAQYFLKNDFKERGILLLVQAKQFQKAYYYAKKFNFTHLLKRIEEKFTKGKQDQKAQKIKNENDKKERKSLLCKRNSCEIQSVLDTQNWEELEQQLQNEELSVNKNIYDQVKQSNFSNQKEVLQIIAKKLVQQGDYDDALQAFLDLKDNEQVMETLIKQKNIAKIIQIANYSRDTQVYILAANYLQTCKIEMNDNVYKSIVSFYSKSKNWNSLVNFLKDFLLQNFKVKNYSACKQILEKLQNIACKVENEQKILSEVNNNKEYLDKYEKAIQLFNQQQFDSSFDHLESIRANNREQLLFDDYELTIKQLQCQLEVKNREKVQEIVNQLIKNKKTNFLSNLTQREIQMVKSFCPILNIEPENSDLESREEIIEEEF